MCMLQTIRGMRDLEPQLARKKNFVLGICKSVFEKYGFKPIETPAVEYLELLTKKGSAGAEIEKEIYAFEDKSNRKLGLRFDLTVPLARYVASNPTLRLPFKRYQIGSVYRYDRPQEKRYSEFTQADIDIVGTESILAEFEIIAVVIETCQKIGLKNFYVKINSRKLLEEIAKCCNIPNDKIKECFRCIDKLDKIGWEGVQKELQAYGLDTKICEIVKNNNFESTIKMIEKGKGNSECIKELKELFELLKKFSLDKYVKLDLSLARGLEYYTGIVFEIVADGPSIGGGGRYDKLIGTYGSKDVPAVGISFGIDRVIDNMQKDFGTESKIFIIPANENVRIQSLEFVQELRENNIASEIDLMDRNISKNLDYANKEGIPFVIVLGDKELKEKKFSLKDMKTGKETLLKLDEIGKLKEIIEKYSKGYK